MSNDVHGPLPSQESQQPNVGEHRDLTALVGTLIDLMRSGGIAELELKHGDLEVELKAHDPSPQQVVLATQQGMPVPGGPPAHVVAQPAAQAATGTEDALHVVTAPMIGTFYVGPAPNEPPFVQVGDHVDEGQTIGIIEAMKIMNEIAADRSGTVVEIVAKNAQTVEYGSPLIKLRPDHTES